MYWFTACLCVCEVCVQKEVNDAKQHISQWSYTHSSILLTLKLQGRKDSNETAQNPLYIIYFSLFNVGAAETVGKNKK